MGRLCVAFLALFLVPLYAASIDTKLVNKDITRTIDLTTHTARHNIKVTVGADLGKSNGDYHIAFSKAMAARIAHIDASFEEDGDADLDIAVDTDPKKDGVVFYRVNLGNLAEGSRKTIVVNAVLTHVMTPLPKATSQTESQKMVYEDDHYVLSPYRTETQKTELKLSSAVIESNSEEPPTQVKREIIAYGPYTNIAAYSTSAMRVHFENNSPFFSMSYCRKEIELSMWGNVAVEEHYELLHRGSNLKGFFSRVDYQRQQGNAPGAIKSIKGELPNGAVDIYYRDAIGNISSSTLRDGEDGPELELVPRFPIFGGWRTEFYMGYNLPLPSYLFRDDSTGRYTLNVTFGSPFEDVVVDDHEVKVILPEGTSNFKVHTSFPLDKQDQEARFTYLDTRGRPVLVLSKSNVIAEHDIHFQVSFDFDSSYIFHEPLLLVGAFFLIFCLTMASSFIAPADFRSDAIATLHAYHDKWTMIRTEFDSVWDKYAKGEIDGAAYKVARSANREAIKGVSEKFQSFVSSLSGDSLAPDARSILMSESELDRVRADMYDAANPDAALPDKALKAVRDKTAHVRQAVHKHQ